MANYNEWITLEEIEKIPGLPESIKRSLSGAYLPSRINATLTGELTPKELEAMRKRVSNSSSVKTLMNKIQKELSAVGYDVKFSMDTSGSISLGFRPKGVTGAWEPGTFATKTFALDRGVGHSVTKSGARTNTWVVSAEAQLQTMQEAQLQGILDLLSGSAEYTKTMQTYLREYADPRTWKAWKAKKLANEFYPATKIGEKEPIGISKSKLRQIIRDEEKSVRVELRQAERSMLQSREIELEPFLRAMAGHYVSGSHNDQYRRPGEAYDKAVTRVMGQVKDVVMTMLTSGVDAITARQMAEVSAEYAELRKDSESWNLMMDKVSDIHASLPMTWSGTSSSSYSGTKLMIGHRSAALPGMELNELGSKANRASSNMLPHANSQRRRSTLTYTYPLKAISTAIDSFNQHAEENFDKIMGQAARIMYVPEGTQFNPSKMMDKMLGIFKQAEKDLDKAEPFLLKMLGKGYKRYWDSYRGLQQKEGVTQDQAIEMWKKRWEPAFQKSLNLEQFLISKGAKSLLDSYRPNPDKEISKLLVDKKIGEAKQSDALQAQIRKMFHIQKGGKTKNITEDQYREWAIRSLLGFQGSDRITDISLTDDGMYQIFSDEFRKGGAGSKAMVGSGLHGTTDVIDDVIGVLLGMSLGFKPGTLVNENGTYKIAGYAVQKASPRTLGGVTNDLLNTFSRVIYYDASHANGNKITDRAEIEKRVKNASTQIAKHAKDLLKAHPEAAQAAEDAYKGMITLSTKGGSLAFQNILTAVDSVLNDASNPYREQIVGAFNAAMVKYVEDLYKQNPAYAKKFDDMPVRLASDGSFGLVSTNKSGARILFSTLGQPDVAIYGSALTKGGRPASLGYKYLQDIGHGVRLARVSKLANVGEAGINDYENFQQQIYEEGLSVSAQQLRKIQGDYEALLNRSSQLTSDEIEKNPGAYKVFTDEELFKSVHTRIRDKDNDAVDQIVSRDFPERLASLVQFAADGEEGRVRNGYLAEDFDNSILRTIWDAQLADGGRKVLWGHRWSDIEDNPYGEPTGLTGEYVEFGKLSFEKIKGADGKTYYVPTDDAEGLMSLEYAQAMQSMLRESYFKKFEAANATDRTTRDHALRQNAQLPVKYFKELEDTVQEKSSNLVDEATKAHVRHSAGTKLIAAPTSGRDYELLSGKARGIMSRDSMRAILRRIDKNENEDQHKEALLRYANQVLGLNLKDDLSTDDVINKMLDAVDIDKEGFDVKNAVGIMNTGARYPLLLPLNVLGMEFFVSSREEFARKSTQANSLNEIPMMLGEEAMEIFNADVDGDIAYTIFSLMDAAAGALSPEQYEEVIKTQKRLQAFSNTVTEKMKLRKVHLEEERKRRIEEENKKRALENKPLIPKSQGPSPDVIRAKDYAAFGGSTETRIAASIAGMASRKNFGEVGKFDNLRQMVQNFERATGGSIWKLATQGVGTGEGQVNPEEIYDYLVASEMMTIFPQEGISSKKVFDKIISHLDKNGGKAWEALSPEEKEAFIKNQFTDIYEKFKNPDNYNRKFFEQIGVQLRDWGLINDKGELEIIDEASEKRANSVFGLMAALTGDDSWVTDVRNHALTFDEIIDHFLKYHESTKGRRYRAANGNYKTATNGLADIFKYGKSDLLPNSKVANLKSIGGMAFSLLPPDVQAKIYKDLRYNPEAAARILGLTPDQATTLMTGKTGDGETTIFNPYVYRGVYGSMTGYHSGGQEDLVESALQQFEKTKQNPNYIRPSSLGGPLMKSRYPNPGLSLHDQVGFWDTIHDLKGSTFEDLRNNLSYDTRESLSSLYNSNFMDTNRGQLNNIAQILAMYGRTGSGDPVEIKKVWDAYKNSNGSIDDFEKVLVDLGVSPEGAKAIASEFNQQTTTREELIAQSVKELGLDETKTWDVDKIKEEAEKLVRSGTDDQAKAGNKVLSAINLHAQGGGPAQLLANIETLEALEMARSSNPNPQSPHMVDGIQKMIDTSARALHDYRVVGREQNLIGFLNDSINGATGDDRIAALAGSSDLILEKSTGGVRIADYKSVRGVPLQMQTKYLAQLLAYGYAYNQMRDRIRTQGYGSYDDFLKSREAKLYTRMKGEPISKDMFELMKSDNGYLDELAINYTDAHGNERVYVGKYDALANSAAGQSLMGALLQERLHPGTSIPWESMTGFGEELINKTVHKSTGTNEYLQVWSGKEEAQAEKRYRDLAKEAQNLYKDEKKIVKMAHAVGESVVLDGDAADDNSYQAQRRKIAERIDMIEREKEAIRSVSDARADELKLIDEEFSKTTDLIALEQENAETKEKQKLAYETVNQSLKDYTGYAQQMAQLEQKMKRARGTDRLLISSQMEMLQGYADDALQGLTPEMIKQMSPDQKRKTLVSAQRSKRQLDLAMAGSGGEKQGLFSQFSMGLKSGLGRMYGFSMLGYKLAGYLGGSIKKIMGYAAQLDQAMVNIQIVTGKTRDGAYSLIDSYNDLAKQLGSTTTEVANSANVWLRQGYSVNKVNELITSSLYLSKLGMLDTGTAARDLTGIIKGFKLEVSDATDVVSKLTMIDQNAAVSAGNIATAMQQVSASAQQAGLDIDTTMGYISTIADVSQRDPSSVGAALRTIISRYGTVKAGAFAGMGVDNTTDDLENINDIEKVLRRLGISIRTSTMEFKAMDDVLGEVAGRWNEWSSVERNAVATAFAGTRQRESFLILMSNYEKAKELTRVAAESQGAAEMKYQAYMDSAEAATKRVQNAWEGLTTSLRSSELLKGVKNTIAWLVENLDKIATTLTSIFVGLKAARSANLIRSAGGFGSFFGKKLGMNFKSGLHATTPEEIREAQKTGSGRVGLRMQKAKDWYMGVENQDIASYMPQFRTQLDRIIELLGNNKVTQTQNATTKGDTTGGKVTGTPTGDTPPKDTEQPTEGGEKTTGDTTSGTPEIRKVKVKTQTTNRKYKGYEINGKIYYKTKGGWHEYKTGEWVSAKEARELGLTNLKSQRATNVKNAAAGSIAGGVAAGITQGIGTGLTFKDRDGGEASDKAKGAAGVASGATSAVLTGGLAIAGAAFGGPAGAMIGQTIGSTLGGVLGPILGNWVGNLVDAEAIRRRERAKEASAILDAIKGIKSDTTEMRELANAGEWGFDSYQKASTMATNMMTKLYSEPGAARTIYETMTGEDTSKITDAEILRNLESLVNDEYLNATPAQRKKFASQWEYATANATDKQAYAAAEDDIATRQETISKGAWGVTGAGGVESDAVNEFVSQNPEYITRLSNSHLALSGTLSERVQTARRLVKFLQSNSDNRVKNGNLVRYLNEYIQKYSVIDSDMTKSSREFAENTVQAAGASLKLADRTRSSIKAEGREQIAKEILDAINERGGFYEFDPTTGEERFTKYTWSGSLDTLPEKAKNEILKYINNDEILSNIFTNNKGYTLSEILSGNLPGVSTEASNQYLLSFAQALGMSTEQLADNADRLKDFTLGDLTKGYEGTKADIDSLADIFNFMASASGLTADNMETILSKFPTLAKYMVDQSSLAKAIYDDIGVLIEVQQQTIIDTMLDNNELFTDWKDSLPDNVKKAIEGIDKLNEASSARTFYEAFLKLNPNEKKELTSDYENMLKQIDLLWKGEFDSMQSAVTLVTSLLDTEASYLSKLYDIQIQNLESQKTALQQITSQREYENKLIDARNKLENAQNEKRQVYREGVGIVYEADQEAVQQAQKELEELDRQKEINTLEVMITELQSQKSWLDQYHDREAFNNMETTFKEILGSNKTEGLWGTVNHLAEQYDKVHNLSSSGVAKGIEDTISEQNADALASYQESSYSMIDLMKAEKASAAFASSGSSAQLRALAANGNTYAQEILNTYGEETLSYDDYQSLRENLKGQFEALEKIRDDNAAILNTNGASYDTIYMDQPNWSKVTALDYGWDDTKLWQYGLNKLGRFVTKDEIIQAYKTSFQNMYGTTLSDLSDQYVSQWIDEHLSQSHSLLDADGKVRYSTHELSQYFNGHHEGELNDLFNRSIIRESGLSFSELPKEYQDQLIQSTALAIQGALKPIASLLGLSMNGTTTGVTTSVDESTNIQQLTMNVNADSTFDARLFFAQVKQLNAITNRNTAK